MIVVQDALANFIDILQDVPSSVLSKRVDELIEILTAKLRCALEHFDIENENDVKRILVCNNACWAIGEIANAVP